VAYEKSGIPDEPLEVFLATRDVNSFMLAARTLLHQHFVLRPDTTIAMSSGSPSVDISSISQKRWSQQASTIMTPFRQEVSATQRLLGHSGMEEPAKTSSWRFYGASLLAASRIPYSACFSQGPNSQARLGIERKSQRIDSSEKLPSRILRCPAMISLLYR
jgi:hypothetical protein